MINTGLTQLEARKRLQLYGPNALVTGHAKAPAILLRQFSNPLYLLLIAAALLSIVLHEHTDAIIVLCIVVLSIGLGFRNEFRAERILQDLRSRIRHQATLLRDGKYVRIDVSELVPGDIVRLDTGDAVPADLDIRESVSLECDESLLTGEAVAVEKGIDSRAYMGTSVSGGNGAGVVVATGARTQFGAIAASAAARQPQTAFQKGLTSFSQLLVSITAVVTVAVLVVSIALHRSLAESLLFALAIAISLTPQLMPVIVSISLSLGALHIARRGAVVKRLISIEDFGNIEVLFTDKTGTLTTGRLELSATLDAAGNSSETVYRYGLLCNSATPTAAGAIGGNTLDCALWNPISGGSLPSTDKYIRTGELPFDFERRLMSVIVRTPDNEGLMISKGAPEAIFARCTQIPPSARTALQQFIDGGSRVIAVATRPMQPGCEMTPADEQQLQFAGFLLFADPPKTDIRASLEKLESLRVTLKVVTGDNERSARLLCSQAGLPIREALSGSDLDLLSDDELRARISTTDLFTRIAPLQKARIIRTARSLDIDIGFLGDGVNDVPALREADVGISVDSATDIAKDAADVVLLNKDLGILADGVLEGRRVFTNTIKYLLMATSSNFGNMISAAIGSIILPFLPLLPSQVLLNNLLYDASELTIPTDTVDPAAARRPSHWDLGFIRRFMLVFGPLSAAGDFAIFAVMLGLLHTTPIVFRSGFFIESFVTQSLIIFVLRTRRVPFFTSMPSWQLAAATMLCAAIGVAIPFSPLATIFGFAPIPFQLAVATAGILAGYAILAEAAKSWFYRAQSPSGGVGTSPARIEPAR